MTWALGASVPSSAGVRIEFAVSGPVSISRTPGCPIFAPYFCWNFCSKITPAVPSVGSQEASGRFKVMTTVYLSGAVMVDTFVKDVPIYVVGSG